MLYEFIEKLGKALDELREAGRLLEEQRKKHCTPQNFEEPAKGKPTILQRKQQAVCDAGWEDPSPEIDEAERLIRGIPVPLPKNLPRIQELTRIFRNRTVKAQKAITLPPR